jgi:hypothetical protein
MKIIITFLTVFLLSSSFALSQDAKKGRINQANEDGTSYYLNTAVVPVPFHTDVINPYGTVPNLITFADYVTNGNHIRKLFVFGDTVALGADYLDSGFTNLNQRRARYNVSYNGGTTWGTDILVVSTTLGHAYNDFSPLLLTTGRTIGVSGRQYVGSVSTGYADEDLQLGLGSFNAPVLNPTGGRDYFSQNLNGTELAGSYMPQAQDTLYFIKFNAATNTFGTPVVVATGTTSSDRHSTVTAQNGQNVLVHWFNGTTNTYHAKESTNGGTSFGSEIAILPQNAVIAGDTCLAWVNNDAAYKPGTTTKCVVMQTVPVGTSRGGYKILFWSPGINSGNPVVIADYNTPNIPILNDTAIYNNDTALLQVNMALLSNPAIAFSSDGSRIFCVFEVCQTQATSYNYHYFDIFSSYSDNGGATWSTPINITNTSNIDEIYPTLSLSGNTPGVMNLSFLVSECPGSNSFSNVETPRCPSYWVFRKYNPVTGWIIGVKTVSNEIPQSFVLHQNYPNPFNPSTKIKFELPKNDVVTLKIYDLLGKEVATVVNNEYTTAGVKEIEFNASNLASGVYYYTLKAGNLTDTKKMVLVK